MKTQLGLETWQTLAMFVVPPLLVALFVIWRAVRRATNHPDGNVLERPKKSK